ncbi:hypothetical protein [Polaribacter sp.]|uniref:hypothetical protein n=1 Tax=Polaribacter sp. TaxID=1920175 RepID=UPI003F6C5D1D
MTTFKILNWKKNRNQCIFQVLTKCGKQLSINDYESNINVEIQDTEELILKVIQFSDDYQFNIPEEKRIKGKKSENEVEKCLIIGNEENVNNLLFSIGWSNISNFHVYKNPLTESLIDELNQIKWQIESEIEDYKKLKENL